MMRGKRHAHVLLRGGRVVGLTPQVTHACLLAYTYPLVLGGKRFNQFVELLL